MHALSVGFEYAARGGWIMIPLLASGLVALTVILERAYWFFQWYRIDAQLEQKVMELVTDGQWSSARKELETRRDPQALICEPDSNRSKDPKPSWSLP